VQAKEKRKKVSIKREKQKTAESEARVILRSLFSACWKEACCTIDKLISMHI